jgi:gliding motility-associated-like protein
MKNNKFFCFALFCIPLFAVGQFIQVDDSYTAEELVRDVLIGSSPCATVSNFTVSGDTFSPGYQSYGYFNGSGSSFPFSEGVILATSRAFRAQGPNINLIDEGSTLWAGDPDLEALLGNVQTFNATTLEFDFVPLASQISFDYIFSSEEYQGTAPCRYSDGFAFLLRPSGTVGPYENLAVIPNTDIPVLVTTVRPEIPGPNGCPARNEQYFGGFNTTQHPTNYNGQTVVMTAKTSVTPGVSYRIKLVIADEKNIRYDSAIFLGGATFKVGTDLGPDRLIATQNPICEGESYILDATEPGNNSYQWFKDGQLLEGQPGSLLTVTTPGEYRVRVNLSGAGCIAEGKVTIEFAPLPISPGSVTLVECDPDQDGGTVFNLSAILPQLTGNAAHTVTFHATLADAQQMQDSFANPTAYLATHQQVIFARVASLFGCAIYVPVTLEISNQSLPDAFAQVCDTDADGIATFNLQTLITPQITSTLPLGIQVNYFASMADAFANTGALPAIYSNTTPYEQIIYARLVNGPSCYAIIPVTLTVNTFAPGFQDQTLYLCPGSTVTLFAPVGYSQYLWNTGDQGTTLTTSASGTYQVTITHQNGCSQVQSFLVLNSEPAVITGILVTDFHPNNTLTIQYTGNGAYVFSLDGENFQAGNTFTGLPAGEYSVFVSDLQGCGLIGPVMAVIMDYPRFFTPNGDGINDQWNIKFLERQPAATVAIFDRYGKLIYRFNGQMPGWDGTANGRQLPASDYWFVLTLESGRTVKSHFTLKR